MQERRRTYLGAALLFVAAGFIAEGGPRAYDPFAALEASRSRTPLSVEAVPDRVLVKMQSGDVQAQSSLSSDLSALGLRGLRPLFGKPKGGIGAASLDASELKAWHVGRLADGESVDAVVSRLREDPRVVSAEPDYLFRLSPAKSPRSPERLGNRLRGLAVPNGSNDPLFNDQWHLDAAKVKAAWAHLDAQGLPPGGDPSIVVAVIDSGIDLDHPDLQANLWVNPGETAGDGVDNDGNGIVDDVHGASFVGPSGDHSGNPDDPQGHGTHVAGIIAAEAGNGEGGVGVAYNVQVMAVRAAQFGGTLSSTDIAEGILYAVEQGADVINMSFGSPADSSLIRDALETAFGQAVLVAAAGNDGMPTEIPPPPPPPPQPHFPAAYPYVVGVMAQGGRPGNLEGGLAGFSNWDSVPNSTIEYEVMAPGTGIWSPLPGGGYADWNGTSMAAPVVSGMAALLRTRFPDKSEYSSRFLMGQLASTGPKRAFIPPGGDQSDAIMYFVADAEAALTTFPEPDLALVDFVLFDDPAISASNDGDGIADAGETIELAVIVRNRRGKASNVEVNLSAVGPASGLEDPFVTWEVDTVNYGAMGSFSDDDNGIIRDEGGLITGVASPFRLTLDPATTNDHLVIVTVSLSADNGFDPGADRLTFAPQQFQFAVQKGSTLPSIISADMTLDRNNFWIIDKPTLVPAGVTLAITEGAQVQFWSSDPQDALDGPENAYLQVEGTLEVLGTRSDPASFFPSAQFPEAPVKIRTAGEGEAFLRYFEMMNPSIGRESIFRTYDEAWVITEITGGIFRQSHHPIRDPFHSRFTQAAVHSPNIRDTQFIELGGSPFDSPHPFGLSTNNFFDSPSILERCLFDQVVINSLLNHIENSVFLGNARTFSNEVFGEKFHKSVLASPGGTQVIDADVESAAFFEYAGDTWLLFFDNGLFANGTTGRVAETAERLLHTQLFAESLGGSIATIPSETANMEVATTLASLLSDETTFASNYPEATFDNFKNKVTHIGWNDIDGDGAGRWIDGSTDGYVPAGFSFSQGHEVTNFNYNSSEASWQSSSRVYGRFVLRFPEAITAETIRSAVNPFLESRVAAENRVHNNAFLNHWWKNDVETWLTIDASWSFSGINSRNLAVWIDENFWGGASTELIDAAIIDFNDDFNLPRVIYEPVLETAPETAWPFVADVEILNSEGQPIERVGAETATFVVRYNRDMDPAIQPQVTFGPADPFTDFTIEGDWQDPRTWAGTFTFTPITGDGRMGLRMEGGAAADDPWLVAGEDAERFIFEVVTSGLESIALQASGGEGYIDLQWSQQDFELLAGFHVYRSLQEDGTFERINDAIIPPRERSFRDIDVEAGVEYFYTYTALQTDMSESDPSNIARASTLVPTQIPGGVAIGGGWNWAGWFGMYFESSQTQPWIYHYHHGFIYVEVREDGSLLIYDPALKWLWTRRDAYPYLYSLNLNSWVYYANRPKGSPLPQDELRWFYLFDPPAGLSDIADWFSDLELRSWFR